MITAALYAMQEKLLFLPTVLEKDYKYDFSSPFEELNLNTSDGAVLNAIHFKAKVPKGVILYFHGNAGDLSRWGAIAQFFVKKHYDVLVMDYRTYGKSKGKLSENAFYSDAQLFYDYLTERYNEADISVYGRSLGTGIASYIASKNKPKQLVLETPYYSISDVAAYRFPFLPVKQLLKYKFPNYLFIEDVTCPITIFHGTKDGVVPYKSADKLKDIITEAKITFITIEGGNHNNLMEYDGYKNEIERIFF